MDDEFTIKQVAKIIYTRQTGKDWLAFPTAAQARVQSRYMETAREVTKLVWRHVEIDAEEGVAG